jgi:hypothetical protein
MQKSKVQRSGNTAELERLEKDLAEALEIKQRNWEAKGKAEEKARDLNKEIVDLKASLKVAYEKIQLLEAGAKAGEIVKSGYVEIAMCPINGEIYPPPSKVDGVVVPRRKDEDGVIFEFMPVKNAIAMMTDGSGFKRYLVGPEGTYKIEGSYVAGMYAKKVVFKKHKKVKTRDGYEFVMVEIEESPEKAV